MLKEKNLYLIIDNQLPNIFSIKITSQLIHIIIYNFSFDFAYHSISLAHFLTHITMDFIVFWKNKNVLGEFNLYCSEGKICLSLSDISAKIKFKIFRTSIHKCNNALPILSFHENVKLPLRNLLYCFKILSVVHNFFLYWKSKDSSYG